MKKLFCLPIILMISGCGFFDFQPELKTEALNKSGVLYGTGSLSTTIFQDPKNLKKFCMGRGVEAAFEQSESGSIDIALVSIGNTDKESGGESESSGEEEMSGRTPAVLITRELFYRACELVINAQLDKKEAIQVFNNVLKVVANGWEKESANTKINVNDSLQVTSTNSDDMSAAKLGSLQNKKGPGAGPGGIANPGPQNPGPGAPKDPYCSADGVVVGGPGAGQPCQ